MCRVLNFGPDSFFSIIHGDLNGHNVLVDIHNEAWLIDFASVHENGHILQDFAALENFVKMLMIEKSYSRDFFEWEKCLTLGFYDPMLPTQLRTRADFHKAHLVIRKIRALAKTTPFCYERAYLISLLFNALRTTTFFELSVDVREHAFLSASVIANKLDKGFADA